MFTEPNALYRLLPAYVRARDQEGDRALDELFAILGDQAAALQRDLERMYDGWFIETCDDWLIPYIGDLVGLAPAHLALGTESPDRQRRLRRVLSARAATANAIAHNRRKGTLWVLEEIARDQAHWPARAVEFYRQTVVASHLDHLQPTRPATPDLRSARKLADLDNPFDGFCHLGDVRRVSHAASRGRFNIPNVALFVWRLRPYTVTATAAYCREDAGAHCFTFSALGHDTQLFRTADPEITRSAIAGPENLPVPISRWALEHDAPADTSLARADPSLYGAGRSIFIEVAEWPRRSHALPITADRVIPADLSDWSYKVPKDHVAVDPVLGRIVFPTSQPPRREVRVSYRYGFAMDIGGGEYPRAAVPLPPQIAHVEVRPGIDSNPKALLFATIAEAYADWRRRRNDAKDDDTKTPGALVIELMESGVYPGRIGFDLHARESVAVVAAPGTRPVIWLADETPGASDAIAIRGADGSRVILDGLLIAGRPVEISRAETADAEESESDPRQPDGDVCEVWIRHCTLVPGQALYHSCEPRRPTEPSLIVDETSACILIESSIVGAVLVLHEGTSREPTPIIVTDSIVDATGDARTAIGGPGDQVAYAVVTIRRSTIVGRVAVHAVREAEDTIFTSRVDVVRRQIGCMRFCYVVPESRTPSRYECQPDLAEAELRAALRPRKDTMPAADFAALLAAETTAARIRVMPRFETARYGTPTYLRLGACVAREIARGALDESEMGVYHDLFEPRRLSMLTDRLLEFVPASADAAVVCAS
jgi:hypothetical protein